MHCACLVCSPASVRSACHRKVCTSVFTPAHDLGLMCLGECLPDWPACSLLVAAALTSIKGQICTGTSLPCCPPAHSPSWRPSVPTLTLRVAHLVLRLLLFSSQVCMSQRSLCPIRPVRRGSRGLQAEWAAHLPQALTVLFGDMGDMLQGAAACRSHA